MSMYHPNSLLFQLICPITNEQSLHGVDYFFENKERCCSSKIPILGQIFECRRFFTTTCRHGSVKDIVNNISLVLCSLGTFQTGYEEYTSLTMILFLVLAAFGSGVIAVSLSAPYTKSIGASAIIFALIGVVASRRDLFPSLLNEKKKIMKNNGDIDTVDINNEKNNENEDVDQDMSSIFCNCYKIKIHSCCRFLLLFPAIIILYFGIPSIAVAGMQGAIGLNRNQHLTGLNSNQHLCNIFGFFIGIAIDLLIRSYKKIVVKEDKKEDKNEEDLENKDIDKESSCEAPCRFWRHGFFGGTMPFLSLSCEEKMKENNENSTNKEKIKNKDIETKNNNKDKMENMNNNFCKKSFLSKFCSNFTLSMKIFLIFIGLIFLSCLISNYIFPSNLRTEYEVKLRYKDSPIRQFLGRIFEEIHILYSEITNNFF